MYKILIQFIPGVSQIWVEQLNPEDPIYIYNTEQEALDKIAELQSLDTTGRQYKISYLYYSFKFKNGYK
jgi:hypothetical protein